MKGFALLFAFMASFALSVISCGDDDDAERGELVKCIKEMPTQDARTLVDRLTMRRIADNFISLPQDTLLVLNNAEEIAAAFKDTEPLDLNVDWNSQTVIAGKVSRSAIDHIENVKLYKNPTLGNYTLHVEMVSHLEDGWAYIPDTYYSYFCRVYPKLSNQQVRMEITRKKK